MKRVLILLILCILICIAAYFYFQKEPIQRVQYIISKPKVLLIQPLGDFNQSLAKENMKSLKKNFPSSRLLPTLPLFPNAYYKPRDRYRADSILRITRYKYGIDTLMLLMTHRDISVTKNRIKDWGIMGLAHSPGNVCVVSTYRLDKSKLAEQLYKVSIHELGHTQGLPHCPVKTCYMRDASGGNPLDEEKGFCPSCKKVMENKGWRI
jgi:archaemetzincin